MTLSVLEGHSFIARLFKCDIFALVLLLLDSFLHCGALKTHQNSFVHNFSKY